MSEDQLIAEGRTLSVWRRHKFLVMVGVALVVAMVLVGVAMGLYVSSGASQLDLSRPGYQSVREQVSHDDNLDGFSSIGGLDDGAVRQFRELYDARAKQATGIESFGGNVMSDQSLSIDAPTE